MKTLHNIIAFFRNYILPMLSEGVLVLQDFMSALAGILSTADSTKYHAEFTRPGQLLSESNTGFCLDGKRQLSSEHSQRNALIVAPTGMGKSVTVVIPSLTKTTGSFLINDPSKEIYEKTAGYLHSQGYDVRVINFANPEISCGYNILSRIENAADCNKIAFMLVKSVLTNEGDPFWRLQSISLITLIIQVLQREDKCYFNMANVRFLLQKISIQPAAMDEIIARTGEQQLINEYRQFLSFDIKVQSGVIATCLAALQLFSDSAVQKVTASDSLNFENLRKKKTAIFIHSSTSDMKYYSVLISILFEQITKVIMAKLPAENDFPVYFILEELSSLYLPTLSLVSANIRKYRGGLLLILQEYQQLIDIYGRPEAESIRANTFAKLYFGGQSHQTASEISQALGQYEFDDEKGIKRIRQLRTADEVRQLGNNQAILIAANYKPMLLKLMPYYSNPFLHQKTKLPVPILKGTVSMGPIQLLDA